jgi:hypothetical protein
MIPSTLSRADCRMNMFLWRVVKSDELDVRIEMVSEAATAERAGMAALKTNEVPSIPC